MQTGIVGLPQVGKTTLFKILTKVHLDAKATQAATHVGVARVPEPRIDKLAALYRPKKVTHATVQSADVHVLHRRMGDRKSTRLNSSHRCISYAVFCLKKKNLCRWIQY